MRLQAASLVSTVVIAACAIVPTPQPGVEAAVQRSERGALVIAYRLLTDGKSRNENPLWSDAGDRFAFAKDEGHGFQKKINRDYYQNAGVLFLQRHLVGVE